MREPSKKNYVIAVSLCFIFGIMGIHHFYAALILIIDYIHSFIVTIMLLVGAFKDGKGNVVCYPGQKLS